MTSLNELGKRDEMRDLPSISSLFYNYFKETKSATMNIFRFFLFSF